jgi:hypothetical protein
VVEVEEHPLASCVWDPGPSEEANIAERRGAGENPHSEKQARSTSSKKPR